MCAARVELHRCDAHVGAIQLLRGAHQLLIFGHRRKKDDAMKLLPFDEAPDAGHEIIAAPVAGMHDELEARAAQRIERAVLNVHDVLRVRVVVHEPDEERAAEREPLRLRIRVIADLLDDRVDLGARLFLHERRLVDDPRDVFFGTLARRAMSLMVGAATRRLSR